MKFNNLKQNLLFVLLSTIATAGISIPLTMRADAIIKQQKIEHKDLDLANQIIDTVTESVKSLFTEKKADKMAQITDYLNNVKPIGPLSTMVLQSVKNDWAQLIDVLKKVNGIMAARKHLEPAFRKLGDSMKKLADKIKEAFSVPDNFLIQLRSTPDEIEALNKKLGLTTKIKIANNIKKIKWA